MRPFPIIIPAAIDRIYRDLTMLYYKARSPLLAWLWGVERKGRVLFQGKTYIRTFKKGQISLGRNVIFNSQFDTNLVGLTNPTVLDARFGGRIEIGDSSGLSSVVISSRKEVRIGGHVKIGGNVRIFDHDFHSLDHTTRRTSKDRENTRSKSVMIQDDVFIGTNAIILKGTFIGARSIVAAGSVVFGLQIPPDSLVKGNPAEIVGVRYG